MRQRELELSLSRIHEWIRAVDQKISIALVFETAIIALISKPTYDLIVSNILNLNTWHALLLSSAFILISGGIVKALWALKPRMKHNNNGRSLIFFGTISSLDLDSFKKRLKKTRTVNYVDDLVEQIHASSIIAKKKHIALRDSLVLVMCGVATWLIAAAYLIMSKYA